MGGNVPEPAGPRPARAGTDPGGPIALHEVPRVPRGTYLREPGIAMENERKDSAGGFAAEAVRLETAAARLEAAFRLDPDLERLWRMMAGLEESTASAGLEDETADPLAVILRMAMPAAPDPVRAASLAAAVDISRTLRTPPDMLDAPYGALDSCLKAGGTGLAEQDRRGEDSAIGAKDAGSRTRLAEALRRTARTAPAPCIAGLKAAMAAERAGCPPLASRLAACLCEHAARKASSDRPGRAFWISMPACACHKAGVAWAPSAFPLRTLAAMRVQAETSLAGLPVLRRWLDRCRKVKNVSGRSRLPQLLRLACHVPALDSPTVAESLAVSGRSASRLMALAEERGLLVSAIDRRQWRILTAPPLAPLLGTQSGRAVRRLPSLPDLNADFPPPGRIRADDGWADRVREAEAMIDEAMKDLDALLERNA